MATAGGGRADKTVVLPPEVKRRLEALRQIPEEPLWRVLVRLLDVHGPSMAPLATGGAASVPLETSTGSK